MKFLHFKGLRKFDGSIPTSDSHRIYGAKSRLTNDFLMKSSSSKTCEPLFKIFILFFYVLVLKDENINRVQKLHLYDVTSSRWK